MGADGTDVCPLLSTLCRGSISCSLRAEQRHSYLSGCTAQDQRSLPDGEEMELLQKPEQRHKRRERQERSSSSSNSGTSSVAAAAECRLFAGGNASTPELGSITLKSVHEPLGGPTIEIAYNIPAELLEAQTTHGLHIHQTADFSNGCTSALGHYNPQNNDHGSPAFKLRHVSDLGNVLADEKGIAVSTVKAHIRLKDVVGRPIVLHADADDLGQGGDTGSRAVGNAGARLACCDITPVTY
jgi:Cu/Zn superoxide dismutase